MVYKLGGQKQGNLVNIKYYAGSNIACQDFVKEIIIQLNTVNGDTVPLNKIIIEKNSSGLTHKEKEIIILEKALDNMQQDMELNTEILEEKISKLRNENYKQKKELDAYKRNMTLWQRDVRDLEDKMNDQWKHIEPALLIKNEETFKLCIAKLNQKIEQIMVVRNVLLHLPSSKYIIQGLFKECMNSILFIQDYCCNLDKKTKDELQILHDLNKKIIVASIFDKFVKIDIEHIMQLQTVLFKLQDSFLSS